MAARPYITVVSGLPRSGTSLMMRMLAAGGIPPRTDEIRGADEDNPAGYFEYEPVKRTREDAGWIPGTKGQAVKLVHVLLPDLPLQGSYRVVFMHRDLDEVIQSQNKMLQRHGKPSGELPIAALKRHFTAQIQQCLAYLAAQPAHFRLLEVDYNTLLTAPEGPLRTLSDFLDGLDTLSMRQVIDPTLYRNRANPQSY